MSFSSLIAKTIFIVFLAIFTFVVPTAANAQTATVSPKLPNENSTSVTATFSGLINDREYSVCLNRSFECEQGNFAHKKIKASGGKISVKVCGDGPGKLKFCDSNLLDDYFHGGQNHKLSLYDPVIKQVVAPTEFEVFHFIPNVTFNEKSDGYALRIIGCRNPKDPDQVGLNTFVERNDYKIKYEALSGTSPPGGLEDRMVVEPGSCQTELKLPKFNTGEYKITIEDWGTNFPYWDITFTVGSNGKLSDVEKTPDPNNEESEATGERGQGAPGENPCGAPGGDCDTAIGSISSNGVDFISKVLEISLGIAGAIALILMVIGSIRVLASSGDQQRLNGGREMIIAAVAGLLFIVFSILILQFIDAKLINVGFQ